MAFPTYDVFPSLRIALTLTNSEDSALCGISPGSSLFVNVPGIERVWIFCNVLPTLIQ